MLIRPLVIIALLAQAPGAQSDWDAFVERAADTGGDAGRAAAEFLRDNHPARDADIDVDILITNLELALEAREAFPWADDVPDDIFLNDVLPYAVLDETRESWRPEFHEIAKSIVADCTTATEAAQALNREFFDKINVHYNTGRKRPNQSPAESIAQGRATCTGLAIILVDACRSVGVPARVAGVANWHDKRGNHTWVEIWDGDWHFTGADEYDANGLDRGWFTGDAAQAVPGDQEFGVWATSWKETGHHFPLVWNERDTSVPGVDVTRRYLPAEPAGAATEMVRHLRAWSRGERIAAPVRVLDSRGSVVAEVTTRAGRADLNDMPDVVLDPPGVYRVEVEHDGRIYLGTIDSSLGGEPTIELRLGELDVALDAAEAAHAIDDAWRIETMRIATEHRAQAEDTFVIGDKTMRILEKTFSDEPEGGHSLWISMHGGGNAPPELNDKQWHNQINLYEPAEGIYVAPRAPTDTWNLWHEAHIDPLFDQLIATYVATRGVNPDKVYLLGYSAGGDGVYQLAPRMADRFAAAAMMAGHPNEAQPLGLRNLPFAIYVGGKDEAYDRNKVAAEWGARLDALRDADPDGYEHALTIFPEYAHWMQGEDKVAIPWMAAHTRAPWPKRVVWYQDDVTHTRFYWLEVAAEDARRGAMITAEVEGQTISITTEDVPAVTLDLSDQLIDLDRPMTVEVNGKVIFEGIVRRTVGAVTESLTHRRDRHLAATARLTLELRGQ